MLIVMGNCVFWLVFVILDVKYWFEVFVLVGEDFVVVEIWFSF